MHKMWKTGEMCFKTRVSHKIGNNILINYMAGLFVLNINFGSGFGHTRLHRNFMWITLFWCE